MQNSNSPSGWLPSLLGELEGAVRMTSLPLGGSGEGVLWID